MVWGPLKFGGHVLINLAPIDNIGKNNEHIGYGDDDDDDMMMTTVVRNDDKDDDVDR